jgi:hypothetical protein
MSDIKSKMTVNRKIMRAVRRARIAFEKFKSFAYTWHDAIIGGVSGGVMNIAGHYAMRRGWLPAEDDLPIQVASWGLAFIASFPLLRDMASSVLRASIVIGNASLVAIGGAVVTVLAYRPMSDAIFQTLPSGSKPGVIVATTAIAAFGGFLGLLRWPPSSSRGVGAQASSPFSASGNSWTMMNAAKHEAGHALVAIVLDLPLSDVHVKVVPDRMGVGGGAAFHPNQAPMTDINAILSHLLRRISVDVSGVLAEENWPSSAAARPRLETQRDIQMACGHMFSITLINPAHDQAGNKICDATWKDMETTEWSDAIRDASEILLRDEVVPAATFREIAQRHGLTMPNVEAVIAQVLHDEPMNKPDSTKENDRVVQIHGQRL